MSAAPPPTRPTAPSRFAGLTDRPLIVGGCPRSGTTLFRTMLNAHPELAVPREMRYLPGAVTDREQWPDVREDMEARERLVRWIVDRPDSRYFKTTKVKRGRARKELMKQETLGSIVGRSLELYAEQTGKVRWGDKRPRYIHHMHQLLTLFPDAQVIEVVRDPRACVGSLKRLGWRGGDVGAGVEVWQRAIDSGRITRENLAPDQFLMVRYEDLVTDPERVLTEVATFAGLDLAGVSSMVSYESSATEWVERPSVYHEHVANGLDPELARSWMKRLDADEIAFVEAVCADEMAEMGYGASATQRRFPNRRRLALRRSLRQRRRISDLPKIRTWDSGFDDALSARLTSGQRALRRDIVGD